MRRAARLGIGLSLVAASIAAMGALTRYRYEAEPDRAELRLAWRVAVPRVVECREPTAEELAELPVHMRQDEICQGRPVRYRLEVRVDGVVRHQSIEEAAGVRSDRPLHVFEELPLAPGARHIRVVFERADRTEPLGGDDAAGDRTSAPDQVVLDRVLDVGVRDVVLVSYDPDSRRLVIRAGPAG